LVITPATLPNNLAFSCLVVGQIFFSAAIFVIAPPPCLAGEHFFGAGSQKIAWPPNYYVRFSVPFFQVALEILILLPFLPAKKRKIPNM